MRPRGYKFCKKAPTLFESPKKGQVTDSETSVVIGLIASQRVSFQVGTCHMSSNFWFKIKTLNTFPLASNPGNYPVLFEILISIDLENEKKPFLKNIIYVYP